jgi:hypothetical protein
MVEKMIPDGVEAHSLQWRNRFGQPALGLTWRCVQLFYWFSTGHWPRLVGSTPA